MKLLQKHRFYDDIPLKWLDGIDSLLEVGAADGWNLLNSIHAPMLKNIRYLGIDPVDQKTPYLNIVKADVMDFETTERFDAVLLCHVIEHIHLENWPTLFLKFKEWLNPGGRLIISCPFDEEYDGINHSVEWSPHVVFNITPSMLETFMPDMRYYLPGGGFPIVFRDEGEGLVRPLIRLLLRALKGSRFVYRIIPYARQIVAVDQKIHKALDVLKEGTS